MKTFITMKDFSPIGLQPCVAQSIKETLQTLDTYYGSNRTESQLGGVVKIVENLHDLEALADIFKESVHTAIPEFADVIDSNYIKATYIISSDFAVVIVFPIKLTPSIVMDYIDR